ncbi:MAG: Ldh family oxidoreductase [Chloroflexota bacterium]
MAVYLRVDQSELYRFAHETLARAGAAPEVAAAVADNLTQGELHGLASHGVSRLLRTYVERLLGGGINPRPQVRTLRRDGCTALVDGDDGPGAVAGAYAMRLAIELAREHGSGWAAACNSNHYGAAFLFARLALPEGMIGFSTTSAVALVAPWGGQDLLLGTNPLCIAVPGGARGPLILDMATTMVARGKVVMAALEGKTIPADWAVGPDGQPTTDPNAALKGRLLPAGGYKGYGLALMVEVFSALLAGAAMGPEIGKFYGANDQSQRMGHFFGALDVRRFQPLEAFTARVDALIALLKASRLEEGVDEILVPGEPEARKAAEYAVAGIPIEEDVIAGLNEFAATLSVAGLWPRAG